MQSSTSTSTCISDLHHVHGTFSGGGMSTENMCVSRRSIRLSTVRVKIRFGTMYVYAAPSVRARLWTPYAVQQENKIRTAWCIINRQISHSIVIIIAMYDHPASRRGCSAKEIGQLP